MKGLKWALMMNMDTLNKQVKNAWGSNLLLKGISFAHYFIISVAGLDYTSSARGGRTPQTSCHPKACSSTPLRTALTAGTVLGTPRQSKRCLHGK